MTADERKLTVTESGRGPEDVPTSERMSTLGAAKTSAFKHKAVGEQQTEKGRGFTVDPTEVAALLEEWPTAPKKAGRLMLDQYGPPNEATPTTLTWYRSGSWKRTVLSRDEIVHNFPTAHTDFLTQYIDYAVPTDKFDEIGQFDGSCLVDRTAGEAAARCDSEAMNVLTLNLMHEIVSGTRTVPEAREVYAENAVAHTLGRSARYTERFQFAMASEGESGDPDESIIAGPMAHQMAEKTKDLTGRQGQGG